jgi:hypothetical protein
MKQEVSREEFINAIRDLNENQVKLSNKIDCLIEKIEDLRDRIDFYDSRFERLYLVYPNLFLLTDMSYGDMGDMIISILLKYIKTEHQAYHQSGYMPYLHLYNKISISALADNYSDKNNLETTIHTTLSRLEDKGIITTIGSGIDRKIQLTKDNEVLLRF